MIKEILSVIEDFILQLTRIIVAVYVFYSGLGLLFAVPYNEYLFTEIIGFSLMVTTVIIVISYNNGKYTYYLR